MVPMLFAFLCDPLARVDPAFGRSFTEGTPLVPLVLTLVHQWFSPHLVETDEDGEFANIMAGLFLRRALRSV